MLYSRGLILFSITLILYIDLIATREIKLSLEPIFKHQHQGIMAKLNQTPAQDRSLRKQKCYEFGKFPWGYFQCQYLGPPIVPFKYWPYKDAGYNPDPAYGSYFQGNYDSAEFDTNYRPSTAPGPDADYYRRD